MALATEPIQSEPDAYPPVTQLCQPAAKPAQSTTANVSNTGYHFVPKAVPAMLKKAAPQQVQFGSSLPPNQPPTNTKMRSDTVPPHVVPPVGLTAPSHGHLGPTRNEDVSHPASLPKLKLAEFTGDPLKGPE